MIAVADTGPLRYLVLVEAAWVLPRLFERVIVPRDVDLEVRHPSAPRQMSHWLSEAPEWLEIWREPLPGDPALSQLDPGERAAITLAGALAEPVILLTDDGRARREAAQRGIKVTGTLGVLRAASQLGLLRLHVVLPRLLATNFYADSRLVQSLLDEEQS